MQNENERAPFFSRDTDEKAGHGAHRQQRHGNRQRQEHRTRQKRRQGGGGGTTTNIFVCVVVVMVVAAFPRPGPFRGRAVVAPLIGAVSGGFAPVTAGVPSSHRSWATSGGRKCNADVARKNNDAIIS